jgi:hypothetical protein
LSLERPSEDSSELSELADKEGDESEIEPGNIRQYSGEDTHGFGAPGKASTLTIVIFLNGSKRQ